MEIMNLLLHFDELSCLSAVFCIALVSSGGKRWEARIGVLPSSPPLFFFLSTVVCNETNVAYFSAFFFSRSFRDTMRHYIGEWERNNRLIQVDEGLSAHRET